MREWKGNIKRFANRLDIKVKYLQPCQAKLQNQEEAKKKNIPVQRIHSSGKIALRECIKNIDECSGNCNICKFNQSII